MPAQSGASEIKPGKNWINRGKDLRRLASGAGAANHQFHATRIAPFSAL